MMSHSKIYKPGTIVYFTHDEGIKMGKVVSVTTQVHETGEFVQWQVLEQLTEGKIIHNLSLKQIAYDLENIEEAANQQIKSFKAWKGVAT